MRPTKRTMAEWKRDIKQKKFIGRYNKSEYICDLCTNANSDFIAICTNCKRRFGENCGIKESFLCRNCINFEEKNFFQHVLPIIFTKLTPIQDINLIGIISSYSLGCIVSCCNYLECENDIYINDKYEFLSMTAANCYKKGFPLQYRCYDIPNNLNCDNKEVKYIYDMYVRIFCHKCKYKYCWPCSFRISAWHTCPNYDIWVKNGQPIWNYTNSSDSQYFRLPNANIICRKHAFIWCQICGLQQGKNMNVGFHINAYCIQTSLDGKIDDLSAYYCSECVSKYNIKYEKRHINRSSNRYQIQNEVVDDYAKYDHELARYDNDAVFRKTCRP